MATEVCQRCGYTIQEHTIFHHIPDDMKREYQEGQFTFDTSGFMCPVPIDQERWGKR